MSGPYWDQPEAEQESSELPEEAVAYYHRMLAAHADDPDPNRCPKCHVQRCPDWWNAYLRLSAAGDIVTEPPL